MNDASTTVRDETPDCDRESEVPVESMNAPIGKQRDYTDGESLGIGNLTFHQRPDG